MEIDFETGSRIGLLVVFIISFLSSLSLGLSIVTDPNPLGLGVSIFTCVISLGILVATSR